MKAYREIMKSYYKDYDLVSTQIKSYDYFIEKGLKNIIMNYDKNNLPDNLLEIYNEIDFKVTNVRLGEPKYIEVDGSNVDLTPSVARLRGLTYAAPLYLEISTKIGPQEEKFEVKIAKFPIMLKSSGCILNGKTKDELIALGEDPEDIGGYFIINGTERVLVYIEDLALNKFFVNKDSKGASVGRMFSERGLFKSLQEISKKRDGSFVYTFGNFKLNPIFLIIKSLGLTNDQEIIEEIGLESNEILFQLAEYSIVQNIEEAHETLIKRLQILGSTEDRKRKTEYYIDNFVLPHIGNTQKDRIIKAKTLCKLLRKYLMVSQGKLIEDDKDHLMNKRLKLSGDLLSHLFMTNFSELIIDILTNFQRAIKRGRFSSLKIIVREQFLTQSITSAMAKGNWSDGRRGISQYVKRENYFEFISHLTKISSPLSTSQENFQARELHATHYGRECVLETPEGHPIGLRKNLALMSNVTYKLPNKEELLEELEEIGLEVEQG